MKHSDFVHLHNHSDYSLLDGASSIRGMVERAAEFRMPALALTDHGSLFGAIEFYQEARHAGVKPILGMEAYVTRGSRADRTRDSSHHLVLLARDEDGFHNLMRLSSLAFLEGFYYRPRVDHEILARYSGGLLALSACPKGEVATDLLEDNEEGAAQTALMYRDMFGAENYFLEVQNHGLEIEDQIRARVARLASRTGIPVVATNDCHYLKHEHADAHDVLLCIQTGKSVDDPKRMRYTTDQVYFKSADEMRARFADHPEALANTLAIAERCNLQLNFGRPLLPEFPLPAGVESAEEHLRELAERELRSRYPSPPEEVRQRLAYELDVICRMGFASYFLIVRDFIAFARGRKIGVGPGRGSVAGSLVAYALHITDIDPIQHDLIFERFLNPERVTMPDIDIDFDDLRRSEVIAYVKQKYGDDNVTQIITFGTMGAKGVVRDVGRALGFAVSEVDRIAKLVPDGLGMTLERALELSPELRQLPEKGPAHERLLKSARVLEGLARHASTHAAGVLITPGPLLDYVPLYRQKDESVTTQWDMKSIEKAGLLKMDFLGLRTLSVLEEAVTLIAKQGGERIDLQALPLDDAPAYKVFQEADTVAIFQFESSGMRDYIKRLKPTVFEDLVAMNALFRPGPMENIPYFIDCKHGKQIARYEHPALEPILKGTYGVFVYQEQVMRAAHELAGFSLAQADELRRAMGKKLPEEMEAKRRQFVDGCVKNGVPGGKAEKIFQTAAKFAGYAFNKCLVSSTELIDADTGERTTIGDLFERRRPFRVHALGEDWKLAPRWAEDVISNGRKPVFEIVTDLGHRITVTANHPFRTLDDWKDLAALAPADRIAVPRRLEVKAATSWPRFQLITLAGLISEGNTCHPSSLYFYGNQRALVEDFATAIQRFPQTVARIRSRDGRRLEVCANLGPPSLWREGSGGFVGEIHGSLALEWVEDAAPKRCGAFQWARSLGLIGRKATAKRVPEAIFSLREDDIALFLGRLWSGDGYFAGRSTAVPYYATSSRQLARDVQQLLLRLGILSRLREKSFRYRGGRKPGFTVGLLGEDSVDRFVERVVPHQVGRDEAVSLLKDRVARTRRGQTSKDTVPASVRRWVGEERKRLGITWDELESASGVCMREFTGNGSHVKRGFRRASLAKVAQFLGASRLAQLSRSDVYWDRIVAIEPKGEQETFDLTVERDHNFVADGIIVHNSHSAAYALLAYQCAWLKAHHPVEFMAATLTSEMSDSARIVTLIEESRRLEIEILPPDVARSEWKFAIEGGKIRFGLGAVRNVGANAVEALIAARGGEESFADLFDLARRIDGRAMNRRALESLVAAGACDSLGGERGALHAGVALALDHAAALQRERASGQASLFGGEPGAVAVGAPPLPSAPPWSGRDRSTKEKEVLGFYFSEHPLEPLREALARIASHTVVDALALEDGAEARVAGVLIEVRPITTRTGKRMASLILEDLSGRIECTVFPEGYEAAREVLVADEVVVVTGRIEIRDDRGLKLLVSEARRFEEARTAYRPALHIEIRAEELSTRQIEGVDEVLRSHPGEAEVYLHIVKPDHSRLAMRSRRFRVREDENVAAALRGRFPTMRVRWGKGTP